MSDCKCKCDQTPGTLLAEALRLWCEEKGVDPERFRAAIFAALKSDAVKIQGTETR